MSIEELSYVGPSFEGNSIAEVAVGVVEHYKGWIDWTKSNETIQKPLFCVFVILKAYDLEKYTPETISYFEKVVKEDCESYLEFYTGFYNIRNSLIRDRTAFILAPDLTSARAQDGFEDYLRALRILCIVDFLINHKPCCRLRELAWLLPAIGAGINFIPIVAYAAEELADFLNDPVEPYESDCLRVGNSWLHRLGVYLLHQSSAQGVPPDDSLIRLMSLATPPPSAA